MHAIGLHITSGRERYVLKDYVEPATMPISVGYFHLNARQKPHFVKQSAELCSIWFCGPRDGIWHSAKGNRIWSYEMDGGACVYIYISCRNLDNQKSCHLVSFFCKMGTLHSCKRLHICDTALYRSSLNIHSTHKHVFHIMCNQIKATC